MSRNFGVHQHEDPSRGKRPPIWPRLVVALILAAWIAWMAWLAFCSK
jgi:hypothetical protein